MSCCRCCNKNFAYIPGEQFAKAINAQRNDNKVFIL